MVGASLYSIVFSRRQVKKTGGKWMANQEHLEYLLQGTTHWNTWNATQLPGFRPDLSRADLFSADLRFADLSTVDLSGAILSEAILSFARLIRANLTKADLSEAILTKADLSGANLTKADLSEAILSEAILNGANLSGANLSGAIVDRTHFSNLDLRGVKGLDTLKHKGPSTIGTDTLERSHGDLPDSFLRGVGLSDTFIAYARSLVARPIEYYTCFISYASHDQDFAERLHADLQSKGVRCWFAPEDLKIGEKFWHRIDESIKLYDKLLVVLSEHSVESEWVEREVMAALEKERQQKRPVLFPITLDEAFKQTSAPWAADIRRSRHTGNFIRWKQHDAYQKAFTRLLRDLKAEAQKMASRDATTNDR